MAIIVLALSRGEQVSALWIVAAGLCTFAISYRFYSKWLATKVLVLNDERATPAVVQDDGKDFVHDQSWMVFGHHFAAIAGPGPLVGPVLAAQFGFLPGTLWILIGATLGGGVHDMIVLFRIRSAPRKNARANGEGRNGRRRGYTRARQHPRDHDHSARGAGARGGERAGESPWGVFTIAMTIPIALIMGIRVARRKSEVLAVTIFGLSGLAFGGLGRTISWRISRRSKRWFRHDQKSIAWAIMIYGLAASILPVWMLLTPRDYLSTFMKLGTVAALAVGGVLIQPTLQMPR